MKKIILTFLFFLLMISFYTFVIPVRMHISDSFEVSKAFPILEDDNLPEYSGVADGYYFTDNSVGYFNTNDGRMVWKYSCPMGEFLTANKYAYVTFRENNTSKHVFNNCGKELCSVATTKIPYFADDLPFFYGLNPGGSFCKYSLNGERLYDDKNGSAMITTIGGNAEGFTIVSDMDGNTSVYSPSGDVIYNTDSKYSEVNFAKSSVISQDDEHFAICSGINPEVMEIYSMKTGTMQHKFETKSNFPNVVMMYMDKDFFYYETENSVNRYNIKNKKTVAFDFVGQMCDAKFDNNGNILILSNEKNKMNEDVYYLNLYSPTGIKYYYKEFNMPVDNIGNFDGKTFYFRLNNHIVVCERTSV